MKTRRAIRVADNIALAALAPEHRAGRRAGAVVSTVSSGGAAWAVVSAVLGVAGGRYRQAAVEGFAAWVAAETAASAIKQLTTRRRPRLTPSGPPTRTSSLPSSHTAAGIAYAVAAGSRAPAFAMPLGIAALGVGWSRLSTRRHFPTDVAAGAVLGVATGAATAWGSRRTGATARWENA